MRKNRLTFIIMIALITLVFMPTNVFAVSGEGTIASPYIITSASDFNFMRSNLSAHYKLGASIALGLNWEPVGSYDKPFTGSFDGDGYILSDLAFSQAGGSVYAGLFGFSTGDIKNVTLKMAASGITVPSAEVVYAGGIVGYNKGGDIENCSVEGKISVIAVSTGEMNVYAGMIAGRSSGIISSSSVTNGSVTVSATKNTSGGTAASDAKIYAGGIVGLSEADLTLNTSAATVSATAKSLTTYTAPKAYAGGIAGAVIGNVSKCQSAGNVVADATSSGAETSAYAGGLAGYVNGNIDIAKAEDSVTAETNAEVTKTYAGGLVGYISGNITKTYATGEVNSETTADNDVAYAGGIAGLVSGGISDTYAIGEASAVADNLLIGGLAGYASVAASQSYYLENGNYTIYEGCGTSKTAAQLKSQETFANWDFTNTWKLSDNTNDGYPYLIEFSNVLAFFEDTEYTYDGKQKTLTATNVAENVSVIYSNNTGVNAGVYNAVATLVAEGYSPTQMTAKLIINPAQLTIKGLKVNDKEFDNTTKATIDISEVVIEGIIEGDDVSIDAENSVANFLTDSVGENLTVLISEIKLKGADAANYTTGIYYSEANIYEGGFDHVEFEGSGTQADPYLIYDEDELSAMRGNLKAHFKLMNNIELTDNWVPVGNQLSPFEGNFNGNNYTISGMSIDPYANYDYAGLFGYSLGNISNINIVLNGNICTNAENLYLGGVAGYNGGKITNCIVTGNISTNPISTFVYVGGVAGFNGGTITYCNSGVNIDAQASTIYAGGFVGENDGTVQNSVSTGDVTGRNVMFAYAGGFAGMSNGSVSNCYSRGDAAVEISNEAFMINVGGFVGRIEAGTISYCYSTGKPEISVAAENYVLQEATGGFTSSSSGLITNCYYDTTLSGKTDADKGIPKTTTELKTEATFTGWDFSLWEIDALVNDGYPNIRSKFVLTENAVLKYADRTVSVSAYTDIKNATLIVASYKDNVLVDYDHTETFSIGKGETKTYTVKEKFNVVAGGEVKVMLWKSFESMMPLCSYEEVPIR